jgi:hypothetical protein
VGKLLLALQQFRRSHCKTGDDHVGSRALHAGDCFQHDAISN